MKNNIFYILLSFILFTVACQEDEEFKRYDLGSEFYISDGGYTSLDEEVTIEIENPLQNLSQVTVTHLGGTTTNEDENGDLIPFTAPTSNLGTITLSGGAGSMTLTSAQLGMTKVGWSADFKFDAVYEGKAFSRSHSISVAHPISVEDPHITHRSDTVYYFQFAIEPATATVQTVTVETKTSSLDTYTALTGPFDAEDEVPFVGADYAVGDTIFVRVTGTVGTKSATKVAKLIVSPNSYENVEAFVLDSSTVSTKAYDLMKQRYVIEANAGDSADIQLTTTTISGGYTMGFAAINNLEFVAGTAADYSNADIVDVEENTDFSTPLSSVSDVAEGDVYIFRTKRGTTGDYMYGVMQVVAVNKPQGVLADSSIEIEYKY